MNIQPRAAGELPLLEHFTGEARNSVSLHLRRRSGEPLPKAAVLCFMASAVDALRNLERERGAELRELAVYHSETGEFPLYAMRVGDATVALAHCPVGAPAAAILADLLIDEGVRHLVAAGGCGMLDPLPLGKIMLPTCAIRDEGTSFHYLEPAAEVALDEHAVACAADVLDELGIRHECVKVWTCDALFRETNSLVALRRAQGCRAVDMECSALAAVARHYGASFVELLYSGDSLCEPGGHADRGWMHAEDARMTTLRASLHVAAALQKQ